MTTNDRTQTDETGGQKPTDEESRAVRHFDAEARLRGELDDTVVTTAELDTHLFAATSLAEVKRETGHGLCCYEPANKDGETILREPDNYSARIEVDSQHVFNAGDLR